MTLEKPVFVPGLNAFCWELCICYVISRTGLRVLVVIMAVFTACLTISKALTLLGLHTVLVDPAFETEFSCYHWWVCLQFFQLCWLPCLKNTSISQKWVEVSWQRLVLKHHCIPRLLHHTLKKGTQDCWQAEVVPLSLAFDFSGASPRTQEVRKCVFRAMLAFPWQRRQVLQAQCSLKVLKLSASSRAVTYTVQAQGLLGAHVALGLWGSEAMHLTWAPTPWHQEEI